MERTETATIELGRELKGSGYHFVTPTPETHRRVLARSDEPGTTLRDLFGWSRPCRRETLPLRLLSLAEQAGVLLSDGHLVRSSVRFSSINGLLCMHSAYPTLSADSVFFGPDTYRFVSLLRREVGSARRLFEVGCGTGAGAFALTDRVDSIVLGDVNTQALRSARVNAAINGIRAEVVESDVLRGVEGRFDLIIANPPYLVDERERAYRHGGGSLGLGLAERIVRESLERLEPGGRLVLYTGVPIVDGTNPLAATLNTWGVSYRMEELDPDVFGEELERPAYGEVERIAAVSCVVTAAR